MTPATLLAFNRLTKFIGAKMVVANLSAELGPGNVALVGHNGAGKSTLLSLLAGVAAPDEGEIMVAGISLRQDPVGAKRQLAYVPDKATAYPFLTGRQFIDFVKSVRGHQGSEDLHALVDGFGLAPYIDKRFDEMSLGTQKKIFLVTAFINSPSVVFMDEPTNAIDKKSRALLAGLLNAHLDTRLVLFATHDTKFAEQIGARQLHMANGRWARAIAGLGHTEPVPHVYTDP